MVFSTFDWPRVQPGLFWQDPDSVQGSIATMDAAGSPTQCEVTLQVKAQPDGSELLSGTICQPLAGGDVSCVDLQFDLRMEPSMHLARLAVHVEEKSFHHREMSVSLSCAATLTHWVVQYLALKLGAGWLLQLELDKDKLTDRAASKLMEELLLACELTAESIDDCAGCLPPLGIVE